MKLKHWLVPGVLALALMLAGCSGGSPPRTAATATPEVTATPQASPTPTAIPPEMLFDITVFPPTCQANGYSVYVSRETGGINIRDEVPRLNHDYSDWSIDMATGAMRRTCSMCGEVDSRSGDGLARIILFGDAEALARDGAADMEARFVYPGENLGFTGWARVRWPGYSDQSRRKVDLSLAFFDDEALGTPRALEVFEGVELSEYTLAANVADGSQVRQLICARIWKQIDAEGRVCESVPVTVYVNGEFRGLYAITVPPGETLYGMRSGQHQAAVTAADRSWETPAFFGGADIDADWRVLFDGEADGQWVKDDLNALLSFVRDSSDADFHEQLRAYLDTDSAIDYLLFMYGMGLSRSSAMDIALLKYDYDPWMIAPFDMSDAFNLGDDGQALASDVFLPVKNPDGSWDSATGSPLWDRLLNVFSDEIALRWRALRQDALSEENVAGQVRRAMDGMSAGVYRADRALFRRRAIIADPALQMQNFVHERLAILDGVFGNDGGSGIDPGVQEAVISDE